MRTVRFPIPLPASSFVVEAAERPSAEGPLPLVLELEVLPGFQYLHRPTGTVLSAEVVGKDPAGFYWELERLADRRKREWADFLLFLEAEAWSG